MSAAPSTPSEREAAARGLQTELMQFKRTLHLIRTGSTLHRSTSTAGIPILGALYRGGPLRATALAAEFCLDPSTVSRQIDTLVRSGHAEKIPDPADGRASLVQLTEQGHEELQAHNRAVQDTLRGVFDDWTPADLTTLTRLLGRLNADVHARFAPSHHSQENQ